MTSERPIVSVVTPFYNTAKYLDGCIQSVLAQTLPQFEYLLVNNCSTDGSAEIARHWATRDSRIRVIDQSDFVGQAENYNRALALIAADTRYVKIVQADDWIFPECLQRMVAVADLDPAITIVGSYYLSGLRVFFSGLLPIDPPVHEGRAICRLQLQRRFFMGNPTTVLYRADSVRARTPFFEVGHLYDDGEVFFELLRQGRYGFVPQILAVVRVDNEHESIMGANSGYDWFSSLQYTMIRRFGPDFLAPEEARAADRAVTLHYGWRLLTAGLTGKGRDYFAYHRKRLAEVEEVLSPVLLLRWAARVATGHGAGRSAAHAPRIPPP
jgi:glycosyltransferase involved in cell wall biosynthesis